MLKPFIRKICYATFNCYLPFNIKCALGDNDNYKTAFYINQQPVRILSFDYHLQILIHDKKLNMFDENVCCFAIHATLYCFYLSFNFT